MAPFSRAAQMRCFGMLPAGAGRLGGYASVQVVLRLCECLHGRPSGGAGAVLLSALSRGLSGTRSGLGRLPDGPLPDRQHRELRLASGPRETAAAHREAGQHTMPFDPVRERKASLIKAMPRFGSSMA